MIENSCWSKNVLAENVSSKIVGEILFCHHLFVEKCFGRENVYSPNISPAKCFGQKIILFEIFFVKIFWAKNLVEILVDKNFLAIILFDRKVLLVNTFLVEKCVGRIFFLVEILLSEMFGSKIFTQNVFV